MVSTLETRIPQTAFNVCINSNLRRYAMGVVLGKQIEHLVRIRQRNRIRAESNVDILMKESDIYVALVVGRCRLKAVFASTE